MISLLILMSCGTQELAPITIDLQLAKGDGQTDSGQDVDETGESVAPDDAGENTPPSAPEAHILPEEPSPGSGLSCAVRTASTDPDEGDPLAYDFSWEVDNEPYPLTAGEVEGGITQSGEYWTCFIRAFDGTDWSDPASFTVLIEGCDVGSLAFTGEDYVEAEGSEGLALSNVFTIEAYTKLDAEAIDEKVVIVSQVATGYGWWFGARRTSNGAFKTEFVVMNNGVETSYVGGQLPASIWRHVSVSVDGLYVRIFLNGDLIAEEPWQGMPAVSGPVLAGTLYRPGENGLQPDQDGGWQGLLDQVHISDDVLYTQPSQPDLQIRPTETSLLFFDFNEGMGETTEDFSGSGWHGTLYGPTWTNDSPCSSPD